MAAAFRIAEKIIKMNKPDLMFAPEAHAEIQARSALPWKVLIVDDDQGIHDVTMLALKSVTFSGRPLEFIHSYSGRQACAIVRQQPDIALILLDVVMENDHAGLDVARYIREVIKNQQVRIVLRTGQPGMAPEREIIAAFDINDYKDKTELTSVKLFTLIHSCLRSYRDIVAIDFSKKGLARVIDASATVSNLSGMESFTQGVLEQLSALVAGHQDCLLIKSTGGCSGVAVSYSQKTWKVITGTGSYAHSKLPLVLSDLVILQYLLDSVVNQRKFLCQGKSYAAYFEDKHGGVNVFVIDGVDDIDSVDGDLVQIFMRNVSIAHENITLQFDLEETQREIVCLLGEAVERRSMETGNHVRRVAAISELLALAYGLSEEDVRVLKYASPLHDIGKIAIPDAILNKPGIHTPEENAVMRTHAEIGYHMLATSNRKVLQAGGIIAHEHHEHWNGKGYPQGKAGKDIPINGRITAVADVFDALANDRCYKKAWSMERILEFFEQQRGKQFDPELVDLLFERLEEVKEIQLRLQD
jgi:response regulator RpfG family c-di-GMP phosphodiesterase